MGRTDRLRRERIQAGEEESLAALFGKLRAMQHVAEDLGRAIIGQELTGRSQPALRCVKCGHVVPLSCIASHPERCKGK